MRKHILIFSILALQFSVPLGAAEPAAIGRLHFWIPADSVEVFDRLYAQHVTPYLDSLGFVESDQRPRETQDYAYNRLYDFTSFEEVNRQNSRLVAGPRWREILKTLGSALPTVADDDGLLGSGERRPLRLYSLTGAQGRTVPLGPGKRKRVGSYRGSWRHFGKAEGFDASLVSCFYEDPEGSLWLGTRDGVVRHRNGRFQTYEIEGSPDRRYFYAFFTSPDGKLWAGTRDGILEFNGSGFDQIVGQDVLPGGHAHEFVEDSAGHIWTSADRGVARFDGSSWTTYDQDDGLPGSNIRGIVGDRQGRVWFVVRSGVGFGGGLAVYEDGQFRSLPGTNPPEGIRMWSALVDVNGHLWASAWGAIYRFDGVVWHNHTTADGLPNATLRDLVEDSRGRIWYWSSGQGVGYVENGVITRFAPPDNPALHVVNDRVVEDAAGHIWFGSQGGAVRYDGRDWQVFGMEEGLSEDASFRIYSDRLGRVWLAGFGGTLSRYDQTTWHHFTTEDGLPTNNVISSVIDNAGNLWFGSWGGGMGRFDGEVFTIFGMDDGLPSNRVRRLWSDPTGGIWAATRGGISQFDPKTGTLRNYKGRGIRYRISSVTQDSRGHTWAALWQRGVVRLKVDRMDFFDGIDGVPGNVSEIMADRSGNVWFGAYWSGPVVRMGEKSRPFGLDEGIPDAYVRGLLEDRKGNIWIGTLGGGVCRYDGSSVEVLTSADGLASDNAPAVFEDAEGHLWFGTRNGVSRYDGRTITTMTKEDGLSGNYVRSIVQDQEGDLWFSTNEGVTRYRQPPELPPTVNLSAIVSDRRIEHFKDLAFPSNIGLLTFEFDGASHATRPDNILFKYRLEGYDDAWRETRSRRVEYANLPGGDYTLSLQAVDRDLVYSDIVSIPFSVHAPYREIALVTGLVLALGLVALQGVRIVRRDRRLRDSNQALSNANNQLFQVNRDLETANVELQRDRAVERIRAEVQSMDRAEDFEKVLSLLTSDLNQVGLEFASCEIDVLDEPLENPSMSQFEADGFRYTTYTLDPDGHVASEAFVVAAPFPAVNRQTIERFIDGEPWQAVIGGTESILEVPAGSYGRLRLIATERDEFTEEETATLREFADAVALGYARYLDIREIQLQTERKSAFLASMSHELRTPMNAIKGFTNLVLRRGKEELSDRNQENLEKVSQASDHLLAMINDLLDLSKIEAGRMDVSPEVFDVAELIKSCCDTVSPLVQDGVKLSHEVADDIGEANTDRARLQQMVINLLSNAIKFTDSGRVTMTAAREQRAGSRGPMFRIPACPPKPLGRRRVPGSRFSPYPSLTRAKAFPPKNSPPSSMSIVK